MQFVFYVEEKFFKIDIWHSIPEQFVNNFFFYTGSKYLIIELASLFI